MVKIIAGKSMTHLKSDYKLRKKTDEDNPEHFRMDWHYEKKK